MSQCPNCQHSLPDDFGLIECPGCKAPLFIQMDGSIESVGGGAMSAATEEDIVEELVEPAPPSQTQSAHMDFSEMLVIEAMAPADAQPEPQPLPDEVAHDVTSIGEAPNVPIVGLDDLAPLPPPLPENETPAQPDMAEASDVDAFFDDPEPAAEIPTAPITDLSQLANETEAMTGSLRYTVSIAGIDTAEIRTEFRDLISDRRFLWDVEGILRSIQAGRVRMQDMSAVKAILLIHRLRSLPVHVQWEQHVVHQD